MSTMRVVFHGLALTTANFASILIGFLAFKALGFKDQVLIQLPVTVVSSCAAFVAWILLLRAVGLASVLPRGSRELPPIWLAALLWAPLIFIPLHYFTQGYMTSAANLVVMALYQAVVNPVALLGAWYIQPQKRSRACFAAPTTTIQGS